MTAVLDELDMLEPRTVLFYRRAMSLLGAAGVPFLVGGAFAFGCYTGIRRFTKDFDIFLRRSDFSTALAAMAEGGYRTDPTHPHWLGKAWHGDDFVDLIYGSGNGMAPVDDGWFAHAESSEVLGIPVQLCPPEEILWSKAWIMERERFDGADVAHLLRATAHRLDWDRLLHRFGGHSRVLLAHLVLFGFVYPAERTKIPERVMRDLLARVHGELDDDETEARACQGTLLSRQQYLVDVRHWGYEDARLVPSGRMTEAEIAHWTAGIANDGSCEHEGEPHAYRRRG